MGERLLGDVNQSLFGRVAKEGGVRRPFGSEGAGGGLPRPLQPPASAQRAGLPDAGRIRDGRWSRQKGGGCREARGVRIGTHTLIAPGTENGVSSRTRITYEPKAQELVSLVEEIERLLENEITDTLIVLNTVRDARKVYETLAMFAQGAGYQTFYLTTQVTPKQRLERIEAIRDAVKFRKEGQPNARQRTEDIDGFSKPILVVSTQLIEAGVDIDVSRVVRDAAPFDSLLQVAGRANRHAERDATAEI